MRRTLMEAVARVSMDAESLFKTEFVMPKLTPWGWRMKESKHPVVKFSRNEFRTNPPVFPFRATVVDQIPAIITGTCTAGSYNILPSVLDWIRPAQTDLAKSKCAGLQYCSMGNMFEKSKYPVHPFGPQTVFPRNHSVAPRDRNERGWTGRT